MTQKPLSQPGVFAFRSPAQPAFHVSRNLLLLFCVPDLGLCTGLISDIDGSPAELKEMLDNAFQHLLEHLGDHPKPIQAKLFGASHGDETHLRALYQWLEAHGLKLAAKDLGRNFPRHVRVETATGRVAVSYGRAATAGSAEILTLGSARARFAPSNAPHTILFLSSSPVERQLAQQAIEEFPEWKVECPLDSAHFLAGLGSGALPYALVLLCEGAARQIDLENFLSHSKGAACAWIGADTPAFLRSFPAVPHLGSLDPEFLGIFKGQLAELLRSLQGAATPAPATSSKHHKIK